MSILQYFPYPTPRDSQKEILQFIEDNWNKFDVFVIVAPTASGKTALSKCIMDWHYGSSYIAPSNILVDQFLSEFPNTDRLHRLDAYWCEEWQQSCAQTRARRKGFCHGCTCSGDLVQAKYRKGSGVYNYHTYLAHRLERKVLIADECLPGKARVALSTGSTTIANIYKKWSRGESVLVRSWNGKAQQFEDNKVTHAWRTEGKSKPLVRLVSSGPTIRCTANHQVLTDTGWKEAGRVTTLDRLVGEKTTRSGLRVTIGDTAEVVIGSILGDGYWRRDDHCSGGKRLGIRHSKKQLSYLQMKAEILGVSVVQNGKSGYTGEEQYVCNTAYLEDRFIENKKKALDALTPASLAIWFCDDGSLSKQGDRIVGARLHTESWSVSDIDHAIDVLHSMGIEAARKEYKGKYNYISIRKKSAERLVELIAAYVPQCMAYKTNFHPRTGRYVWQKSTYKPEVHYVIKTIVDEPAEEWAYDIEVENAHNFLTTTNPGTRSYAVVHNCHNLEHTIQDRLAETIWHHDYQYPFSGDNSALLRWIEKQPTRVQKHKKIAHLREALEAASPEYVVSRTSDTFNGKGTQKGKPEERDCIKLYPVDISDKASLMWGPTVEKIILMSATIGPKDIEGLGLQQRRVVYLQAASPIPPKRRPIQFVPVVSINHENLYSSIPRIAEEIENIAAYHSKEKGIIHATYEVSSLLREHLTSARFLFHDRNNKAEQYERFRNSPTSDSRILVACGMYEGIDLPEDLGRWQVIARTPWKSLADPAIRFKAEKDRDWFRWETLKDLIQACGRICRTPTDYGVTYILDATALRLVQESQHLIPGWFMDAVHAGTPNVQIK